MINGFFLVKKKTEMRDIYLKYKFLNNIIELINKQRSILKLQNVIKSKLLKNQIENKKKSIQVIKSLVKINNAKNKIKSAKLIESVWRGYKVRKNIIKMKDKTNKYINNECKNIIEDNVKNVIKENKVITIEVDNVINNEITDVEDEIYYNKKLDDGMIEIEDGMKKNINGCTICCCGIGNVMIYLWYKICRGLNDLMK